MNTRLKKASIAILKLLVSATIIYFVFSKINLPQLIGTIKSANLLLLIAASILFVLSKVLSSVRLNYFLSAIGVHITQNYNLKLYLLGMYYNLFLPGGIGGDGYKIYHLKKKSGILAGELFKALFLDRVTGVLALFILIVLLSYGVNLPFSIFWWIWIFIPLSMFSFYMIIKRFYLVFIPAYNKTNILSFAVQLSQLVSAGFILIALHQFSNIVPYLFLFLISSIIAVIPFTIGGIGSREITFMTGAQWLHLNIQTAVAVSVIFFFITAVVSFAGIYYSFAPIDKKSRK